ncbi:tetratricopeptide repeat protein [Tateyamaria sp. SN6-1]|uniref:tetratricopeptide repeat protein n=1 Tax=Tateyamaria sp. SN6-1 TaxID=3092148 RepID=UPI0039F583F8
MKMLKSATLAIIAVLGLSATASAQEIVVRSGAHEGFSRLVIRVPDDLDWSLDKRVDGARFSIIGYEDGFDTSQIFDLIDRRFISAVSGADDHINLDFACECEVTSFVEQERFVVLDVAEKPSQRTELTLPPIGPVFTTTPLQFGDNIRPSTDLQIGSEPDQENRSGLDAAMLPGASSSGPIFAASNPNSRINEESVIRLADVQAKLAHEVAIASTQGMLESSVENALQNISTRQPQVDTRIFDSSISGETDIEPMQASQSLNIRITSSSDFPDRITSAEIENISGGVGCISPAAVAIESWGVAKLGLNTVAQYRSRLFSEFDKLNENVALKLAQLYLYLGFGAEAKQVLSLDSDFASENIVLIEMAEILEYGFSPKGRYLHNFSDCDSAIALWGILSQASLNPATDVNIDAALQSINALPVHLRHFLAPELSNRLLEYGELSAAESALRSIDRAPIAANSKIKLAQAELESVKGNITAAQDILTEIISSNEEQSAEALIKFVNASLEKDKQFDESVATLVEAYAIEMRGTKIGAELHRTHVLALAKSGQFAAAFEVLDNMRRTHSPGTKAKMFTLLMEITARSAPDVVFLNHAFQFVRGSVDLTDGGVKLSVAERLTTLGFSEVAEEAMLRSPTTPVSERAKKLAAQISLDLGRPSEAEAQLFGVNTEEAHRIRARARWLAQDYTAATELYSEIGEARTASDAAWLAGDWQGAAGSEQNPFATVTQVIEAQIDDTEDTDGMLGRFSNAVSESERARSVIRDLLEVSGVGTRSQ